MFKFWIFPILLLLWMDKLSAASSSETIILWTQKSHLWSKIRGIRGDPAEWVNGNKRLYTQSKPRRNKEHYALGYNPLSKEIYWSDQIDQAIYKQPLSDNLDKRTDTVDVVLDGVSVDVRSLAVDWLTGNIYFSEGQHGWVGVTTYRRSHSDIFRILFNSGIRKPTGVAVDPFTGLLFWADASPDQPKIEKSRLTGSGRNELDLKGQITAPMGITLDMKEQRIFWVDRDMSQVSSCGYDGDNVRRLNGEGIGNNYLGIALTPRYVFVTAEASLKLDVYDRKDGSLVHQDIDAIPYHIVSNILPTGSTGHQCKTLNCEHLCLNEGAGRGRCDCKQGSYLGLDGRSCPESHPYYVYSVGDKLLFAEVLINQTQPDSIKILQYPIAENKARIQAIDFHYKENLLYFSDTVEDVIYRGISDGSHWREHTVNTRSVEGIAVEWATNNVYWADRELKHIMVSRLDGRYHTVLREHLAVAPIAVTVDSLNKVMFWTNENGNIMKAGLGGSTPAQQLEIQAGKPRGLVVDSRNKRLYWADSEMHVIESVNLDGKYRKPITGEPRSFLYDVTIYPGYVTWTQGNEVLLFSNEKSGIKIEDVTVEGYTDSNDETYDVITYDTYMQPFTKDECTGDSNGGCQHLCFPTTSGHECGCAIGYTLHSDKSRCISETRKEYFIMFVDPYHKQIYQQTTGNGSGLVQGVPVPDMDYPISVDYDRATGLVYWIDRDQHVIKSSNLDGSEARKLVSIDKESKPERLVVSPMTREVYYSDRKRGAIYRFNSIDGSRHEDVVTGLTDPFALAIDHDNELLYWSSYTDKSKLESTKLDGSERQTIVEDLSYPTGIAVIPDEKMVFYSERNTGKIVSVNVSTMVSKTIFSNPKLEIYSLAADHTHVYFTTWNEKGVYKLSRMNTTGLSILQEPIYARVLDIHSYEEILPIAPLTQADLNLYILLAALLAALLLLCCLITAIVASRKRNKKKDEAAGDAAGGAGAGGASEEVDRDYTDLHNSSLLDARGNGHTNGQNGQVTEIPLGNGGISNGGFTEEPIHAQFGTNGSIYHGQNGIQTTNLNGDAMGVNGGHLNTTEGGYPEYTPTGPEPDVIPPPVVVPIGTGLKKSKRQPAPPPKDNKNDFELKENNVATVIQRLTHRLRNRLSTVRWNQSQRTPLEDSEGNRSSQHRGGRTAKELADKKRASGVLPDDVTVEEEAPPPPPRKDKFTKNVPKKTYVPMPSRPMLHRSVRGFAPASHGVPSGILKATWGKAKSKKAAGK